MIGYTAIESGDFETARPLFEDAVRLLSALGYHHYVGLATFNLGWACEELGDVARGRQLQEENLRRARSIGSASLEAGSLDALAWHALEEGKVEDALRMQRESLGICRELGDIQRTLDGLSRIARSLAQARCARLAAPLLSSSLALHEEIGLNVPPYQQRRNDATLALLHGQLDEAAFAEAWEHGRALTVDEAVALALDS